MKVQFYLPNFTNHSKLNLVLLNMKKNMPNYFRDDVEITSIYGVFPPSIWNGGHSISSQFCNAEYISNIINAFNNQGVSLCFTFTNPAIKEEHLKDEFSNAVMKIAENDINEVVVNSPILEEYIRNTYPKYKITSSVSKIITDVEELQNELAKDYNSVVVDWSFNNKFDVLENLSNKDKCRFILNSFCYPDCEKRADEYYNIGLEQIAYCEHFKENPNKPFNASKYSDIIEKTNLNCSARNSTIFDIKKFPHYISPDDIWNKYVPMGFNKFQISGKESNRLYLIETYMNYLIKPEYVDEARFMFLYNLERNGVVRIDGDK